MMRDTDRDWAKVAETHPYWGVLSVDAFRSNQLSAAARAEFFATGDAYVAELLAQIKRHFQPNLKLHRTLDFGCGVGRLLMPLARVSGHATGIDVAPAMLKLSQENLRLANISNATLVMGDDTLSALSGQSFDLVNTFIVLQHIPPERGYPLIERLLSLVAPGGIASLQMTYARSRTFWPHEQPRARFYRRDGTNLVDLLAGAGTIEEGTITMYDYDLNAVMLLCASVSSGPVVAIPTDNGGHYGVRILLEKPKAK